MSISNPVVTVDGPSGVGKGTLAMRLAQHLGWHLLDSGALYRVLGLAATQAGIDTDDETSLAKCIATLDICFKEQEGGVRVWLNKRDVTAAIRTEQAGNCASQVAIWPAVRNALLQWQQNLAQPPGLVADGRDMGTVVFPDAPWKIFLTASSEVRAQRRYKQLLAQGIRANIPDLLCEIEERDMRDQTRSVAPLIAADDAICIDTSYLSADDVFFSVLKYLNL